MLDAIDSKGSFAAAAEVLFRVPSAVTYTVQKLEEDMGFAIFRREGRRSVITPAGRVLLEQGRELLQAAEQTVAAAHQVNSGWEPQITIALDTLWDINQFFPILKKFYQLNTGVQVNLIEEVMGGSLDAMIEGRADILVGGPPPVNPLQGLKFEKIAESNWVFVVAKDHPLLRLPQPIPQEAVRQYVSVVISDSSKASAIRPHRAFTQQAVLRVASMTQKISAQIQGVGVGFLPIHKIHQELAEGRLVIMDIEKDAPVTPQYCAWRTANKGRATRWFVEQITASATV